MGREGGARGRRGSRLSAGQFSQGDDRSCDLVGAYSSSNVGEEAITGTSKSLRSAQAPPPWGKAPNARFPRAHLWSWEGALDEFEAEFETITDMALEDTAETRAQATTKMMDLAMRANGGSFRSKSSSHNRKSPGRGGSPSPTPARQASAKSSATRPAGPAAAAKLRGESRGSRAPKRRDQDSSVRRRRFSLTAADGGAASASGNKGATGAEADAQEVDGDDAGLDAVDRYRSTETPTPPPELFGYEGDKDHEGPDEDPHEGLLKEQERQRREETSLNTFLKACTDSRVLPEPLLTSRYREAKSTMEASKMHNNLDICCKAGIEKQNSRDRSIWDWKRVAKVRTPDELKLEHYGMGDQYMAAMAKGLEIDAVHARNGKRALQRFSLKSCRITPSGCTQLMRGFAQHPIAKKLDLSDNLLGPSGIGALCTTLSERRPAGLSLLCLDLSGNGLGDTAVIDLFNGLRNSKVEWLDLSRNQISGSGALEIERFVLQQRPRCLKQRAEAEAEEGFAGGAAAEEEELGTPSSIAEDGTGTTGDVQDDIHFSNLTTLILDWNKIRGQEASRLIRSFDTNVCITELSLSWNGLGAQQTTVEAITAMLPTNRTIRSLGLAHNLFSKSACEEILAKMLLSKSLLSVDLSGNERHENIFLRNKQRYVLHKLSECWPQTSNDLSGTSYIYTRYAIRHSRRQRRLSSLETRGAFAAPTPPTAGKERKGVGANSRKSMAAASAQRARQEKAEAEAKDPLGLADCLDSNVWKRRGMCWMRHRWTKHTIWYYPGISGPPSREVFLLLILPGGAAMCTKMKMMPSKQASMSGAQKVVKRSRPVARTQDSSTAMANAQAKGGKTGRPTKAATKMLLSSKQSSKQVFPLPLPRAKKGKRDSLFHAKKEIPVPPLPEVPKATTPVAATEPDSSDSDADPIVAPDECSSDEEQVEAGRAPVFDPYGARKRKLRRQAQQNLGSGVGDGGKRRTSYDYAALMDQADNDRNTGLGAALLDSIRKQANFALEEDMSEEIANLTDLSLSQQEPVCPCYATVMLPPGRIQYKFVVRGKQVFARDQDTCWTRWPIEQSNAAAANAEYVEHDRAKKAAQGVQSLPSVVNCIDVKWPMYPVAGLANPDPGSEREQPVRPWSVHRSIFRYHPCDTVDSLRATFTVDWERSAGNAFLTRSAGEELDSIRELIWANYSQLYMAFAELACMGDNCFAVTFDELRAWLNAREILPMGVPDSLLSEIYDQSALVETRSATNAFGKHYSFMVKKTRGDTSVDSSVMLRHQFLQFLVLVAIKVYAPSSRPSMARAHTQGLQSARARARSGIGLVRSRSRYGGVTFETPFEAVHYLLTRALGTGEADAEHRDVFRRGHLFFQDIVNVFVRKMDFLRSLFDTYSVKGHVLHDFVPSSVWEQIANKSGTSFEQTPLRKIFALSKSTYADFSDVDFAPGLCFLEFLECLARLAHMQTLAHTVVRAFNSKQASAPNKLSNGDDALGNALTKLIDDFEVAVKRHGDSPEPPQKENGTKAST